MKVLTMQEIEQVSGGDLATNLALAAAGTGVLAYWASYASPPLGVALGITSFGLGAFAAVAAAYGGGSTRYAIESY